MDIEKFNKKVDDRIRGRNCFLRLRRTGRPIIVPKDETEDFKGGFISMANLYNIKIAQEKDHD